MVQSHAVLSLRFHMYKLYARRSNLAGKINKHDKIVLYGIGRGFTENGALTKLELLGG
ncbi:hypothetical protein [Bacillus canaveralius]|uniref:hypothetical protein n=1 Tax=Bacillus canaveralius TaxID=1403243 RepID=UPI001639C407|nr:hypothetical protein [Bacillus canaveralius]